MRSFLRFAALVAASACAPSALAQTTDGYHSVQVFPVVVDTASFTQRFHFKNPTGLAMTIQPRYVPADGTSQATAFDCQTFNIPLQKAVTFDSLRAICPALAAGSQFGFLHLRVANAPVLPFAAFSRVSNPQGNGFSVEAFPAHAFTAADGVVNGLRRKAASGGAPAFQTNCFLGLVNSLEEPTPAYDTPVVYVLFDANGVQIGQNQVLLKPGRIVRLLDVFTAANAPAGDHDNAQLRVLETGPDEPGVMAFCTVQDNTSFGADFRIAKQEIGDGGETAPGLRTLGAQTDILRRRVLRSQDSLGRPFVIPAGSFSNTHIIRVRQPDFGFCELIDPATNVRALPSYGLEMRVVDEGETALGGDNSVQIPDQSKGENTYFGDRAGGDDGADGVGLIEVESNEQNTGVDRPYKLQCVSGSGMTPADIVRYQEAVDRF